MATRTVWALNLDAEVELSRPRNYATRKDLQATMEPYWERAIRLLPADAFVLGWGVAGSARDAGAALPRAEFGAPGLCWCPTTSAMRALKQAGAEPVPSPTDAVLARVNHREFCATLGQTLPGAGFARDRSELNRLLQKPSITGVWLCKRAFGCAGRGQRRLGDQERPGDRRWLADCLEPGGLQVEPWVDIRSELSLHGVVRKNGAWSLGAICRQRRDGDGGGIVAERIELGTLTAGDEASLFGETERVAAALHGAGYFGPFGVDAYLWCTPEGELRLNPRSEINARLTLAFPVGMGPDWLDQVLASAR